MKNFTDLEFTVHKHLPDATQAQFDFSNGYGVSVITGEFAYTSKTRPYEIAVILHGAICYDTPLTNDVLGFQTADDVRKVMAQVAALPTP